jgi:microcin C transport system substrate-binding protein
MNTRRDKFKDPRVREAMILAFDFEWTNKNLMYDSYDRTHSYFQNSDMMAKGKPSPEELALLAPHRDKLPAEVFGEPFVPPVSDGSGNDRVLLRRSSQLLQSAGYSIKNGRRENAKGELDRCECFQGCHYSRQHQRNKRICFWNRGAAADPADRKLPL